MLSVKKLAQFPLTGPTKSLTLNQCVEIRKELTSNFELMWQKGIFPYSLVDSMMKLDETTIPIVADFYDTPIEEHISQR